ncbi:RNA-directed DNA polymerase, eukaryota, reverse transcriptase zinc-binding domain protein [Tanacetum coccineum]
MRCHLGHPQWGEVGFKDIRENRDADDVENVVNSKVTSIGEEKAMDAEENGNVDVIDNDWDKSNEAKQDNEFVIHKVCDTPELHNKHSDGNVSSSKSLIKPLYASMASQNNEEPNRNHDVSLDNLEPNKIPIWVKMFDIPLEAWNNKGISKLVRSIGKPLIIDAMTANMCQFGRGRLGYARVLIEVDAKKYNEGIKNQNVNKEKYVYRPKEVDDQIKQQVNNMNEKEAMRPSDKLGNGTSNGSKGTQSMKKFNVLEDCDDEENGRNWERMINKGQNEEDIEDVMEDMNGKGMMVNEIEGMIVNGRPWVLLGDFNVTLYAHAYSTRGSSVNQDMQDFKDCVSINELEDLCSSRFQFTWTKSPKNHMYGTLKKLDRVMSNEKFIDEYGQANENFLPYIISDHNPSMEEETTILKEYKEAVMDENKLLAQKAMIKWMKDRDKNTAFFHKVVKGRKHRSRIESICDETGKRFYSEDVPEQFVKHFQQFLRTESRVQPMVDCDQIFFKKLNDVEAFDMIKDVTNEEIKTSMFDIDNDKAHGSDGFTSCFLKRLAYCRNRYMCSHQGVLSYKETT